MPRKALPAHKQKKPVCLRMYPHDIAFIKQRFGMSLQEFMDYAVEKIQVIRVVAKGKKENK